MKSGLVGVVDRLGLDEAGVVIGGVAQEEEEENRGAVAPQDDDVEELFMDQRLDHFDRQESRTFRQRYFVSKK